MKRGIEQLVRATVVSVALAGPVAGQQQAELLESARAARVECIRQAEDPAVEKDALRAAYDRAKGAYAAVVAREPRSADAHAELGEPAVPHDS